MCIVQYLGTFVANSAERLQAARYRECCLCHGQRGAEGQSWRCWQPLRLGKALHIITVDPSAGGWACSSQTQHGQHHPSPSKHHLRPPKPRHWRSGKIGDRRCRRPAIVRPQSHRLHLLSRHQPLFRRSSRWYASRTPSVTARRQCHTCVL